MKPLLTIITAIAFFYPVFSQQGTVSIITQKQDSVNLQVTNQEGTVQWQVSEDGQAWTDIPGATAAMLGTSIESGKFYRAHVTGMSCGEGYTNAVYMGESSAMTDTLSPAELTTLLEQCSLSLHAWYGKEAGYDFTESGTDIYTWGRNNTTPGFAMYDSNFYERSGLSRIGAIWNELYRGLMNCNAAVHYIGRSSLPQEEKAQKTAEIRFLRAVYLWKIVETWGGTMYTTKWEPVQVSDFSIMPADSFYAQIYSDLAYAEDHMKAAPDSNTVLSSPVVKAFTARMHITRGNYAGALDYAQQVIASGHYSLLPHYDSIFSIYNKHNSEIIYAVDYHPYPDPLNTMASYLYPYNNYGNANLSLRDGCSQNHIVWATMEDKINGITRELPIYRSFNRYLPTRFFIELFNPEMDQRFRKSFKSVWYCNTDRIYKWPDSVIIDDIYKPVSPLKVGNPLFAIGDTAFVLSEKPWPRVRAKLGELYHYKNDTLAGYTVIDIDDMYQIDGTVNAIARDFYFPIWGKYNDPTLTNVLQTYSRKNVPVIRLAEMVLIAAEAALMEGYTDSAHHYLLTLAEARSYTGDAAGLLSAYGINSGTDIDIDFILDERARELATEQLRWFDLKRTGKLVERVAAHNPDATPNIKAFHNIRPIPLEYEFLMYKTDYLQQNPGYFE